MSSEIQFAFAKCRRILLISNTVMHYRVSVYNYFWKKFREKNWEFEIITNHLQSQNKIPLSFRLQELDFNFFNYRRAILQSKPDVVILFLHLKDKMIWPLIHWLKFAGIPFAFWTKTRNLDDLGNLFRNALFDYVQWLSDALILYSGDLMKFVPKNSREKVFVANNTINFEDFPEISESKAEIKKLFGIPFGKVVLFAGRMDVDGGRKRVDHLIELFRDVDSRDAGLVIVGSGFKDEWRAQMNPRTTLYLGEIHDPENRQISRIFKMADVCAIPGHVGLGLNQAFYFGLPVVTEEGNHPPEIGYLQHGRNGFIVPRNDLNALRAKIFYLLDSDAERAQFSANARADILKNASIYGMFDGFFRCAEFLDKKNHEN